MLKNLQIQGYFARVHSINSTSDCVQFSLLEEDYTTKTAKQKMCLFIFKVPLDFKRLFFAIAEISLPRRNTLTKQLFLVQ